MRTLNTIVYSAACLWKDKCAGRNQAAAMSFRDDEEYLRNVKSYISLEPYEHPFKHKAKQHLKKWWPAHLALFIAITLFFILLLLYVVYPKIAQYNINSNSALAINQLVLSNPSSNGFHLFQNASITNTAPYHPQLDGFNATIALGGGKPYATISIAHLHAAAHTTTVVDQDVAITDLDAFTKYNIAVLNQEDVAMDINGKTKMHEMAFPTTEISYDKSTSVKGLNKLTGFKILDFNILILPEADGSNMIGNVSIPNPTIMSLTMGNVTFFTFLPPSPTSPAIPIGNVSINDLTLTPGDNKVAMRAQVDQAAVLTAISKTYTDGIVPVNIVGNTAMYNGQHLTYFETALQGLTMSQTLDVGTALKATLAGVNTTITKALQNLKNHPIQLKERAVVGERRTRSWRA